MRMSPKHLHRYVDEFSGRHNSRRLSARRQMVLVALGMRGQRVAVQKHFGTSLLSSGP